MKKTTGMVPDIVYQRIYDINGLEVKYIISKDSLRQEVWITHTRPEDKAIILKHLNSLWDSALTSPSKVEQAKAIAEFEWWFMISNPTLRGGASIGDSLSISLQRRLCFPLRSYYRHIDFEVLSMPKDKYIRIRTLELLDSIF